MPDAVPNRSGITRYLGDVLDSTKSLTDDLTDYANDMLDNSEKIQRGLRKTTLRVLGNDRDEDRTPERPRLGDPERAMRRVTTPAD
jgi:hypothetical protein